MLSLSSKAIQESFSFSPYSGMLATQVKIVHLDTFKWLVTPFEVEASNKACNSDNHYNNVRPFCIGFKRCLYDNRQHSMIVAMAHIVSALRLWYAVSMRWLVSRGVDHFFSLRCCDINMLHVHAVLPCCQLGVWQQQGSLAGLLLSVLPLWHQIKLSTLVFRGLPYIYWLAVPQVTSICNVTTVSPLFATRLTDVSNGATSPNPSHELWFCLLMFFRRCIRSIFAWLQVHDKCNTASLQESYDWLLT